MSAPESFKARMIAQGWYQGAYVPWRGELARSIAAAGLRDCDLRADPGGPAGEGEAPEGRFLLISQLCDLTVGGDAEPFAVAIPAGPWDPDGTAPLPQPNSSRWFVIDRAGRIVASQARPIPFPKELVPDRPAEMPPVNAYLLATWCARRWRRIPLPDDFTETVQRALAYALDKVNDPLGLAGTAGWRVQFLGAGPDGNQIARLLAVYDRNLIDSMDFARYVERVADRLTRRLPTENDKASAGGPLRPFLLEPVHVMGQHELSVEVAINSPMIVFDHLSPIPAADEDGDEMQGLRDEDIY